MFFTCAVAFLIFVLFYRALVLSFLWTWFIVPTFGLMDISFVSAFGIVLIADLLLKKVSYSEKYKDYEGNWEKLVKSFLYELIFYSVLIVLGYVFSYSIV